MSSPMKYHAQPVQEVLSHIKSDLHGLSISEAEIRLERHGPNKLREEGGVSPTSIFLGQFKSILIIILILAALISGLVLHEYLDMYVILIIVVLNAVIGFVQEYRAEKAVEALKKMVSPSATVLRDGAERRIDASHLVPGDIVIINGGDRVPADCRLIEVANLKVDEAPLTGESTPVTKNTEPVNPEATIHEMANMVFMGTYASYGRGLAVVTGTGMDTEFGKIAGMIQAVQQEDPPLKKKTERLGRQLGVIALTGCIAVFFVNHFSGISLVSSFMTAMSLAISAIPEGLPTVLIITLSLGAQRMARSNAIVRRLASVETLGTTTIICSDKTGTITRNEMTVRQIRVNGRSIQVSGTGYTPEGEFMENGKTIDPLRRRGVELLLRVGYLCNDAKLGHDEELGIYLIGDPTEGALLTAALKAGLDPVELDRIHRRVWEAPFDSTRKRMTTIHESSGEGRLACVKGAPEVLLGLCDRVIESSEERLLTMDDRARVTEAVDEMAEAALRVLAFAYKKVDEKAEYLVEEVESGLVFVGLVGMIDPPRDEVSNAIRVCKKAGIRPVMITGDHELTAIAIAREVGIMDGGGEALTGAELESMTEAELMSHVDLVSVYSRVSPEHKVRVAQALKARGNIVAMTGDGVNDAPAIKSADIGIAMGIKGTDVTKEAADMVLADDNFATIVKAVESGRVIYDNIRKFMRFLVSSNFDEMLVISSFALAGLPLPLLPVMILWLNLITDGGPAVALSMDVPTEDLMARPPRDPRHGVLHGMWLFIAAYVVLQSGTTAGTFLWKYVYQGSSLDAARTAAFIQACMFELVVVFNCRSEKYNAFRAGLLSNRYLVASVLVGGVLTVSLCYVPLFQRVFHTVPLGTVDWLWIVGTALLGLLVLPEWFMKAKVQPDRL